MGQFGHTGFGFEIEDQEISLSKPRTSRLALASFVLGLLSFIACIFWPVVAIPAVICGIAALLRIHKYRGGLTGKWFAIAGIILPLVSLVMLFCILDIKWTPAGQTSNSQQTIQEPSQFHFYALDSSFGRNDKSRNNLLQSDELC